MAQILVRCNCGSLSHELIVFYDEADVPELRYVYVYMRLPSDTWWRRLKSGLRYIFNRIDGWGRLGEMLLGREAVSELGDFLLEYLAASAKAGLGIENTVFRDPPKRLYLPDHDEPDHLDE